MLVCPCAVRLGNPTATCLRQSTDMAGNRSHPSDMHGHCSSMHSANSRSTILRGSAWDIALTTSALQGAVACSGAAPAPRRKH
eukprot:7812316-Pyramimonas_sp.AAC.1